MPITKLHLTNFRNIPTLAIEPIPTGFNLIYGQNGSGKTSLLESIYYLSLARSFRSTSTTRIIRHENEKFLIYSEVNTPSQPKNHIGLERSLDGDLNIRINTQDNCSIADLADLTPVQLINSACYNLLEGGPLYRRKYLDWGVFYFKPEFLRTWRNYEQVLKQRNAALRAQRPKNEIDSWSQELILKGNQLHQLRQEYTEQLFPSLGITTQELLPQISFKISYYPGWDSSSDYGAALSANFERDMQLGYTQAGPHRGDLRITINKVAAKDILSRGQQKLFVCAMILAQGALLNQGVAKQPIYLIDDLPAELDLVSRTKLITLLSKQKTQVFVTAIEKESLGETLSELPLKMFHVEHGAVSEVCLQPVE